MKKETENKIIELHKMIEGFSMDYHQKSLIRDKINEILACDAYLPTRDIINQFKT